MRKPEKIGGKIHKILNKTTRHRLTGDQYMKLVELINEYGEAVREEIIEEVAHLATGGNCDKTHKCCGYHDACEDVIDILTNNHHE